MANVQARIGPLLLGYLSSPSEIGLFAAASRFGSVARLAPQAVFAGALPVFSHEHARGDGGDTAARLFRPFDRALMIGAAAFATICALFAAPVLGLVYGPSFAGAAPVLVWVSVGLIPLLSNSGRKVFLYATGGEAMAVRWSAVALFIQVCVGVWLIPGMGGAGAASGKSNRSPVSANGKVAGESVAADGDTTNAFGLKSSGSGISGIAIWPAA